MNLGEAIYGRGLALLALALAMMLVWFGAGEPYVDALGEGRSRVEAAARRLHATRQSMTPDNAAEARTEESLNALLLPGVSSAASAAWLQQRMGTLTEESGALLLSFELLPVAANADTPLQLVTGRVRVTANTQGLLQLLHSLETQQPLLLVDNLYVRARSDQDIAPGGHLDVQMDVSGARRLSP